MANEVSDVVEFIKLAGGPTAVVALGWWLRGQFITIKEAGEQRMQRHEHQDERRHRDNLVRFAKLNMKLGIPDDTEMNGGDH